jgi:hypothetical protein
MHRLCSNKKGSKTLVKGNTGINLHDGKTLGGKDLKQTNYKLLSFSHHDECQ